MWNRDITWAVICVACFVLAFLVDHASPAPSHFQLTGKLLASEEQADQGFFFTDPEGESESVELHVPIHGLTATWLRGNIGREVVVTIAPKEE